MILDILPQWHRYAPLNPRFARAFTFLEAVTPEIADGRHDIEGDAAYALVQRYRTRPVADPRLEAHRRFIDIQYLVAGRELIFWSSLATLAEATVPYDQVKEAALFAAVDGMVPVRLAAGQFAIFFPADAHAPCCVWDGPEDVVKVVVKVAV